MRETKSRAKTAWLFFLFIALLLAACTSAQAVEPSVSNVESAVKEQDAELEEMPTPMDVTTDKDEEQIQVNENVQKDANSINEVEAETEIQQAVENAVATAEPVEPTPEPPTPVPATEVPPMETVQTLNEDGLFLVDDRPVNLVAATDGWNTDWERHTIDYEEILAGGPSRDGIPSLDTPSFISIEEASELIGGIEPVIHANHFWFSWAAFKPETIIYEN